MKKNKTENKSLFWKTEKRKISELVPYEHNPRKITPEQEKQLTKSLEKFNLAEIPAINTDNTIIAGHQRLKIMQALGRGNEYIDVRVPSRKLTEKELKEYNLRSNKNTAEWDFDILANNFDEDMLKDVGFDLSTFPEPEILHLDNEDDVPEVKKTDIKLGDMFQLGEHILLCGDATRKEDMEKLMQGKNADMVFTDPPYNVNYGITKRTPKHKQRRIIKNDNLNLEQWKEFCIKLFNNFKIFANGDIYMWGADAPDGMRIRLWLIEMGAHWSTTIIWKKQQFCLTKANYQRIYESCFYGWFDKSSFVGDRKQIDVWEIDRPLKSDLHPTMKPIELCEKGILNSSNRGDIVLDPFGGSGSTLIACEKTNRKCRMMEIDPTYCQVIIDRWELFTGKKAEKIK